MSHTSSLCHTDCYINQQDTRHNDVSETDEGEWVTKPWGFDIDESRRLDTIHRAEEREGTSIFAAGDNFKAYR